VERFDVGELYLDMEKKHTHRPYVEEFQRRTKTYKDTDNFLVTVWRSG
jgi:hypothetical protein